MLKTLRITSLAAVVLAICGVLLIVFLALREDPAIIAYLDSAGITAKFADHAADSGQKDLESPLVAMAKAFSLRIDPPPPPAPPKPVKPVERTVATTRTPPKPTPTPPPTPRGPVNAKFTLQATVMCEENPNRSMVLLRQAGNKDEWFWQGDKVGNLDVAEVRNGSAVFTQNGRNEQVLFVPEKPETKSLLKADAATPTRPAGAGAGSISVLVDPETGEPVTGAVTAGAPEGTYQPSRSTPVSTPGVSRTSMPSVRTRDAAEIRQEVSDRIRRVRTVPKQPTAAEQKENLQTSISSIQQIMNSDDNGNLSEEQKQKENEAWNKLLNSLQEEKQRLEGVAAQQAEKDAGEEGASDDTPSENPNEK